MMNFIRGFLCSVPGSLKNHLSIPEELIRISITAATAGGGFFEVLQAIIPGDGTIFPPQGDSARRRGADGRSWKPLRRLGHGRELATQVAQGSRPK